jgi:plasmid replication initiation protein
MITKNKELELKKHVAAIHSTSSMTLVQRKIANGLLYNAYPELLEKDEHQISIKTLCELIGYDSHDHKTIKKALVNLLSTVIEWNLMDDNLIDQKGIWNASSVIADASINGSLCSYSYSKRMRDLLYRPEMYGRLNMEVQAKFKSSYGLALYENCIRYQNIQQTPWFEFNKFRQLMGVAEDKYLIFRDFKRRVLDKAIAEVNLYAPINIKAEIKKVQRRVTAIKFTIIPSVEKEGEYLPQANSMAQTLKSKYGLTKSQITKLLETYTEEYILEKIALIENTSSFKAGKIDNLAKYLESALLNNFQKSMSSQQAIDMERREKQQQKIEQEHAQKRTQDLLPIYRYYLNGEISKLYGELSDTARLNMNTEFRIYLSKTVYLTLFDKTGLTNPIIQDELYHFIKVNHPELLKNIQTFDEFCNCQTE